MNGSFGLDHVLVAGFSDSFASFPLLALAGTMTQTLYACHGAQSTPHTPPYSPNVL